MDMPHMQNDSLPVGSAQSEANGALSDTTTLQEMVQKELQAIGAKLQDEVMDSFTSLRLDVTEALRTANERTDKMWALQEASQTRLASDLLALKQDITKTNVRTPITKEQAFTTLHSPTFPEQSLLSKLGRTVRAPSFNGRGVLAINFLQEVEAYYDVAAIISDHDRIQALRFMLVGRASKWYNTVAQTIFSWSLLKQKFINYFYGDHIIEKQRRDWERVMGVDDRDLEDYALEGLEILATLEPSKPFHKRAEQVLLKLPRHVHNALLFSGRAYETEQDVVNAIRDVLRLKELCAESDAKYPHQLGPTRATSQFNNQRGGGDLNRRPSHSNNRNGRTYNDGNSNINPNSSSTAAVNSVDNTLPNHPMTLDPGTPHHPYPYTVPYMPCPPNFLSLPHYPFSPPNLHPYGNTGLSSAQQSMAAPAPEDTQTISTSDKKLN